MNEWDNIATSFDSTRKKPWDECINFIKSLKGIGIDLGCGNGRHLLAISKNCQFTVGIDKSITMMHLSKKNIEKNKKTPIFLVCADIKTLPFPDNTFDAALFIASLHNIQGHQNRVRALTEMRRILKPDGTALISVWAKWQDAYRKHFFIKLFNIKNGKEFGDILIPWKKNGLNIERFYHLYGRWELKHDLKKAGLKIIEIWGAKKSSKKFPDNHFALVRK